MIKIEDVDGSNCSIEIKGNAEMIAQQVVALLDHLAKEQPYISDRISYHLDKRIVQVKNQIKQ